MDWKVLISLFAKPLGNMVNNALAAGSGAVIVWATAHGADAGWVTPAVAGIALAISQTISGLAATQGIQIPIINSDQTNGVVVVNAAAANAKNIPAADGPKA